MQATDNDNDKNQRHKKRMQSKKSVVDSGIASATDKKGLIVVNTGNGKGKSSSAFGMLARALGHGMKVAVVQFIKARGSTGEELFFRTVPDIEYHVMGDGFTWETQSREQDMLTATKTWEKACTFIEDPAYDFIVLDELNIVLKYGYLELDEVLETLKTKPAMQHIIITGRSAPQELIDIADTVSEIMDIKHAYRNGIQAQKGIEL